MDPFPHVRVSGGPRERGRQYGEQARDRVRRSIEAYDEVFAHYAGWRWADVRRAAGRYLAPVEAFDPRYPEEIRGIAEGAGVEFEDVLGINVRTEVMFAAKARAAAAVSDGEGDDAPAGRPDGCSAFAVLPNRSGDGHTLIGQNWDWLLHSFETVVVLEAAREDAPDFVTVVEAGLLAKTGMNSSGVGLVTNALVTDRDRGEPGVPYHVVLRGILDAENLSDAYATAQRGIRSSSANYLIASADGIAVDVEAAPGDFSRLFLSFASDGVLLHTNHFLSPAFDGKDVSLWVMPDSPFRLERLRAAVSDRPTVSVEDLGTFLADHANHPSGICCHPDPRSDRLDQGSTVASVLMDLDARRMWVADGRPCTSPYRDLDYGEFLSKPSPVRASTDAMNSTMRFASLRSGSRSGL